MTKSHKWRFDYGEIWGFDDLNEEEKQVALNANCKPGKKYHGLPDEPESEVPQCPICGYAFMWNRDVSCEHMLFVWDDQNCEYLDIDPDFLNYFWQIVFLKMRHSLNTEDIEEYESLKENHQLPSYDYFDDYVPGIVYFQIDSEEVFFNPAIWGFANSALLKEIRGTKN